MPGRTTEGFVKFVIFMQYMQDLWQQTVVVEARLRSSVHADCELPLTSIVDLG